MSLHLYTGRTIPVNVAVFAKGSDPASDIPCVTDTHIRKSHRYFAPKFSDLTFIVNACGSL